jgi:phage terminase large subunit-like protein
MQDEERLAKLQRLGELRAYDWERQARASQLTPPGDWNVWLLLAGRGFGKTRALSEDGKAFAVNHPKSRLAVVAPTFADARDTNFEGETGLITVLEPGRIRTWNRSTLELVLTNGSRFKGFSAQEPERLRGPQHHRVLCDELGAWEVEETWNQLTLGNRLGKHPQVVVATTPRPTRLIRELVARPDVHITRGTTWDNAANLAPAVLEHLRNRYGGTRLGRQELEGQILDDVEGALWRREMIKYWPSEKELPEMRRIVVAIDPATTRGKDADETGIVAAGVGVDGRAYVLADLSGQFSPDQWASLAVNLYRSLGADRIVAETNRGGEMVEHTLRTVDENVSYSRVSAMRGKLVRAEPIAALYEQGRVTHVMEFPELENQLCNFVPGTLLVSPDRMDALVWALTELMLELKLSPSLPMILSSPHGALSRR